MKDGPYSVHVSICDDRPGKGSGVLVFRDRELLGGDAFLFHEGTYRADGPTLRGEAVVNQHTPSSNKRPLFGGREVGIGFSGEITEAGGDLLGTALVGKESVAFEATLKWLAEAA